MLWLSLVLLASAAAATEPTAELPAVVVLERRGFDPQTGAGTSIDVPAARRTLRTTGELLGREAGVTLRSSGGFYQAVSLRGSASNQVQLYLNGVPLPSGLAGALSPSLVPPEALARIDVYRGSVPARFARSPLAGAVDLVTRDPDRWASARAGAGSFGRREGAFTAGTRAGGAKVLAGVGALASDGDFTFFDTRGTPGNPRDDGVATRRNNDTTGLNGFGVFEVAAGDGVVRGHALASGANQGVPGFDFAQASRSRLDQRLAAGAVAYEVPLAAWTIESALFGGELRERFRDPRGELTFAHNDLHNLADQAGLRAVASRDGDFVRPEFAVEAEALRFRASSLGRELPSHHAQRASAVASATAKPGGATLVAAVQGEFNRLTADNERSPVGSLGFAERTRWLPAVSLGAAYPVRHVTLLANAGTGYRVPTTQEQFGDRGIQVGNPRLRPERGRFADAGLAWRRSTPKAAWSTDFRLFRQDIHDLIAVYQTSPRTAAAMNFDAAAVYGAEWQASARVGRLRLAANLTYNRVVSVSKLPAYDGKQLPGRPVWEGGADAACELRYVTPYYAAQAQGDYFLDPVNSAARRVRSRVFHDAGVVVTPLNGARLTAAVENITDVRSFDFVGYPLPGRSYSLVVQLQTPNP